MTHEEWTRGDRVAGLIHHELALLLHRDVRDPHLRLVTINEIKVTRDLAFADVYYTVMDAEVEKTQKRLIAAGSFFRHRLARVLATRVTPRLRFHYDSSLEYGQQMSRLVSEALTRQPGSDGSGDEDSCSKR